MATIEIQESANPPTWQADCSDGMTVRVQDAVLEKGAARCRIQVIVGADLLMTDRITLASSRSRQQFLKRVVEQHRMKIDERVLLALEERVTAHISGSGRSPKPVEGSNAPAEVALTPEVEDLLADPRLLERVGQAMRQRGYVGDINPPLLAYVAFTSRLLHPPDKPMNLALVAQSATGKNRTVDAARDLIPPEAVCIIRASSERAIIYLDEDFQHRVIFFSEADSIPDDGPAASAIRSLASDYVLAYDVPEQNPETKRWETRRIEKAGPTGLITTSTKSLAQQLGTRVLEVALKDDSEQTRAVMQAHARVAIGAAAAPATDSVDALIHLQRWLAVHGEHRVRVPFAGVLADTVPSQAVRMRRDFQQLMTCVQVIALLHERQRARADDGAVIASLDDYAAARNLLAPIFDTIASEGVTKAIRETVEAVPEIGNGVTQRELAEKLKVATATISWRVKRALRDGWLKNMEKREGHPSQLVRGVPLPDEASALPAVEAVQLKFESSISGLTSGDTTTSVGEFECSNAFRERYGDVFTDEDLARWRTEEMESES